MVIYDRVETTKEIFLPNFLLHSLSKPQTKTETETMLAGNSPEDGILATRDRRLVMLDAVPGGRYHIGLRAGGASKEGVLQLKELPVGDWELVFHQP